MRCSRAVSRGVVSVLIAVFASCWGASAGAQGFSAPVLVPTGNQPVFVATADVNGDKIPDLIYIDAGATAANSTTHVLLGDGKGGFKASAVLTTGGSTLAIGDLLGTGHVSIGWISVQTSGDLQQITAWVAPGDGTGAYPLSQTITSLASRFSGSTVPAWTNLLAARLTKTGDTKMFYQFLGAFLSYLDVNTKAATPPELDSANTSPFPGETGPITVVDLNGDGFNDFVVNSTGSRRAAVLLNDSDTMMPQALPSLYAGSSGVYSLLVDDFNGDGVPDLAIEGAAGRIEILPGKGDGTFGATSIGGTMSVDDTQGDGGTLIAAADLNGDKIPDLVTFSPLGVTVELGTASGNFNHAGTYVAGSGAGANSQFVTADFNGDGLLDVAIDAPGGIAILYGNASASAGTSISASPEPSTAGGAFVLTAAVPAGSGGTVAFAIDGTSLGTSQVGSNGIATWPVPAGNTYAAGTHTITGGWLASGHALAVVISGSHAIAGVLTSPGIAVSAGGPTAFEAAIPVSVSLATAVGVAAPTGTVTFSVPGATSVLTSPAVTIVNGAASYTFAAVAPNTGGNPVLPGTNTVTVVYSGDTNYSGKTVTAPHVVNLGVTTVTLSPAPPTPVLAPTYFYGQPINGYVHFIPQDTQFALKGSWEQLSNGVGVPGCTMLSITGAYCPYGYPTIIDAGNYVWVEQYNGGPGNGDPVNGTGDSTAYAFTVLPDTTAASALTSSMNPAPVGTAVTFTVTLTGNIAVPAGMVQFVDGTTVLGTGALNAAGQASFTTSALTVGTHPITAVYPGTIDFDGVTSAVLNQVILAVAEKSMVTLSSSVNPSVLGQPVTFTAAASVPGPFPYLIQSGTMTFLDGTAVIGTGAINQYGRATFTTSTLGLGSHAITAAYPGGASAGGQVIAPSVSAVLTQVVGTGLSTAPPGFTLTVTPNPVTLKPGNTGVELVTVTALSGFSEPVSLSCTGINSSNELGCGFLDQTIAAGGGATTLDLTTTAPYACGGNPTRPYLKEAGFVPSCGVATLPSGKSSWIAWKSVALGAPMIAGLLLMLPRRRRRWARLLAVVLLAGVVGLSGCGNCTNLGTKPGNYEVTVTGTAGSVTHSVVVKLDVLDP